MRYAYCSARSSQYFFLFHLFEPKEDWEHAREQTMDGQRPHSAPLGKERRAHAHVQQRPKSAFQRQETLGKELATRSKRIQHLEERLRMAKESAEVLARKKAARFIRRSGDGAETFYDGWVTMNEHKAKELDEMQRGIRCAPVIVRRASSRMPSVHDPSFARKGDQAVRTVYGRMIPLRPPDPESKPPSCPRHRQPSERVRAILQQHASTHASTRVRAPAYRTAPEASARVAGVHRPSVQQPSLETSTAAVFGSPDSQVQGNAKLDRSYHPSQHGRGRAVIRPREWDGGPPSRERTAEIATPGYYPFGPGTVLLGPVPTDELSKLFRHYNGRVPPPQIDRRRQA